MIPDNIHSAFYCLQPMDPLIVAVGLLAFTLGGSWNEWTLMILVSPWSLSSRFRFLAWLKKVKKGMVIYYINIAKHRVKKFPREENNAIAKIKMGRGRMAERRQAVLKPKLICLKTWFYDRLIICMPLKLYFRYYRLICKLYVHTYIFFLLQK